MITAQDAYTRIETESREKNIQEIRFITKIEIGQVIRQGDIYLHCVKADHPHGEETKNRQLAPGSTQGSRHVVEREDVTLYLGTTAPEWAPGALIGPVIVTGKKRIVISHPEHAHVSLPEGVTIQVTYQMDARTLQRVQD